MIERVIFAGGYALAAGLQPGPLQAFLLARVAQAGWRRTLPAALSPVLSDGPVALVVLVVLGRLPAGAAALLRAGGGVLLLYLAAAAVRQATRPADSTEDSGASAPRTLLQATAVNLLNPNPYLGWALVLGPAVLDAWRAGPLCAVVLLVTFYVTIVVTIGLTVVAFGAAEGFGARTRKGLVLASAAVLAALGVWQLAMAVGGIRS